MTEVSVAGTAAEIERFAAEVADELEALRERAADVAMAQQVAERRGDVPLAAALARESQTLAAVRTMLRRHSDGLHAWRQRLGEASPPAAAPAWPEPPPVPAPIARQPAAAGSVARTPSASLIEAQEEERRRLARDIHDGPAQLLANVVFRIDVAQKLLGGDGNRARAELEQLKQLVRHSLQDVRKIIFDLRPLALDDLGLVPALRSYLSGLQEKIGLQVRLRVTGAERRLATAEEVALFRLVQEALHNVGKHADTDQAAVDIAFVGEQVTVRIADRGRGFDPASVTRRTDRLGLRSMRERAELFGGTCTIASQPGAGTVVTVSVPAPARVEARPQAQ